MTSDTPYLEKVKTVGETNGTAFNVFEPENGKMLKKISVWLGKNKVKGIEVCLTNDNNPKKLGVTKNNTERKEFIFEDGEHCTSLSLWKNGKGTHLGAIKFKTNHSREFYACMESKNSQTEVPVEVASGYCMGIKGFSDQRGIACLGFIFISKIKSAELTDVVYEGMYMEKPPVYTREVDSMTYYNNTNEIQEYRFETSKKIVETSSWSVKSKSEHTFSLEVKGAIPKIGDMTGRYTFKPAVENTYPAKNSTEKLHLYSFPVNVPPRKKVNVYITLDESKFNLNFNGKIKITCLNGSVLEFKTSGTYEGVTHTGGEVTVNEYV